MLIKLGRYVLTILLIAAVVFSSGGTIGSAQSKDDLIDADSKIHPEVITCFDLSEWIDVLVMLTEQTNTEKIACHTITTIASASPQQKKNSCRNRCG